MTLTKALILLIYSEHPVPPDRLLTASYFSFFPTSPTCHLGHSQRSLVMALVISSLTVTAVIIVIGWLVVINSIILTTTVII